MDRATTSESVLLLKVGARQEMIAERYIATLYSRYGAGGDRERCASVTTAAIQQPVRSAGDALQVCVRAEELSRQCGCECICR